MDEITAQAVEELGRCPASTMGPTSGVPQLDQIVNVNSAEGQVSEEADYGDTITSIESAAAGLPDVSNDVLTYSEQRVTDVLGRGDDEIVVRVYGADQAILETKAEDVKATIAGIDLENLRVELPAEEPTIEVQPDVASAEQYGSHPATFAGPRRPCCRAWWWGTCSRSRRCSTWPSGACRRSARARPTSRTC